MSADRTPRDLLAEADREREVARWAETMRATIRLGRPIKLAEMHQRGPFGRKHTYMYDLDDRMPGAAVNAIYRALGEVRNEAEASARSLESRIAVNEAAS